ncbi:MAG: DUF1013 domain-containing protein [Proteobacteria bacterium]|nr:DUF1013 domain-containing protein [Pseudomonadota bacterium]MDA1058990.1 DUF1013 domain-containing protein [Pseudomonadota bacterium]
MPHPLMPKATAVWLIDNTSLGFDQIADFCGLHALEVQGIADGEVAVGIVGRDPVTNGELTRDEIERCQGDRTARMVMLEPEIELQQRRPGPKYTPLSKRQNRPDAIAWLIKFHPELTDAQVCQLVGTTKPTVVSVRDRSHWNTPNLKPQDPVSLGMSTQTELDSAVQSAAKRIQRKEDRDRRAAAKTAREKQAAALAAQEREQAAAAAVAPATPEPEQSAEPPSDLPDTALGAALAQAGVVPADSGSGNENSGSES